MGVWHLSEEQSLLNPDSVTYRRKLAEAVFFTSSCPQTQENTTVNKLKIKICIVSQINWKTVNFCQQA